MKNKLLVTAPGLIIFDREGKKYARNPMINSELPIDELMIEAFDFFSSPRLLVDFHKKSKSISLTIAIKHMLIIDIDLLARGAINYLVADRVAPTKLAESDLEGHDVILGIATDIATSMEPGARNGPASIRGELRSLPPFMHSKKDHAATVIDFEFRRKYAKQNIKINDVGDLTFIPGEGIQVIGERISMLVDLIINSGARPILLGGDHSITHWSLKSTLKKFEKLAVIHFDAHHDLEPSFLPHAQYITHANPFRSVLNDEHLFILMQLGLRTVEEGQIGQVLSNKKLTYRSAYELSKQEPEVVFSEIDGSLPCYISFDIDCLAPEYVKETGTPCIGGLTFYKALELIDYAARHLNVVAFDMVEVAGSKRGENWAAKAAARLIYQVVMGRIPFDQLANHQRNM